MEFWAYPTAERVGTTESNSGTEGTSGQRYAIFPSFGGDAAGVGVSVGTNGISVFEHGANLLSSGLVYQAALFGWKHIAVVYQNRQPTLYVNGLRVRTGQTSSRPLVYPSAQFGGDQSPYGYYAGLLDEVSIYNRALATNEIAAIYSAGAAGKCTGQQPAILAQPQSLTNTVGTSASFVVTATGTAPLTYQWWFQGTNLLAGATNSTLTLSNLVPALAGGYFVVVSNPVGIATSTLATLTVLKATPTLTWGNPKAISYGTRLGSNQLNATASVPGSFAYAPPAGTVLRAGPNALSVVFTPADAASFNSVTGSIALVVLKAPLTVTANNATRFYGATNPPFTGTLTGVTNGDNLSASFTCAATPASPVGTCPVMAAIVDPNSRLGNYTVATNNGSLTVFKATPTLTWTNPPPVAYGTALGTNQLNASASVAGSFAYNPTNGAVLNVGSYGLSVVFTPADAASFNVATGSVALVVQKASLNVTANNATRAYGVTKPPFTASLTGVTNGDPVTATYSCAATPASLPGAYAIVPVLSDPSGRLGNYIATTNNGTLAVTNSAPLITTQPQSQSVVVGDNVAFIVTATGIPPLSYQWQFNGTNLSTGGRINGAASTNLTIANVQLSDAGNYSVLVSSFGNSTSSAVARLTAVAPPPTRPQGSAVGFGWNAAGQTNVPAELSNVVAVAAGYDFSLAVRSNGLVVAWGNSYYGSTAVPADLTNAVSVAAGNYVGMALRNDGTVVAWGNDGGSHQTNVPADLTNATAIAAGGGHSLALRSDGSVIGWGNVAGTVPANLSNAVAIAAGGAHSLALRHDGTAVTWGDNAYGQLGMPAGLSNLTAVAGGSLHSVALRSDGTVVAWGRSHVGQTKVPAGLTNVVAIAAGPYAFHCLAIVNAAGGPDSINAPVITAQPQSVTAVVGAIASFSVTAAGSAPLSYQWRRNGAALPSATTATLTLPNVQMADAGNYNVVVTNVAGSATSQVATLTVTNVVTARVVRVLSATNWPGASVSLPVELTAQGDENTVAFSLAFEPSLLTYRSNALGTGVLAGAQLIVNTNEASQGRIGVLLGLPSGAAFTAGPRQVAVFSLQLAASLTTATNLTVEFGNQPVAQEVGSVDADGLPAQFVGGVVAVLAGYEADVSPRPYGDGRLTGTDWTLVGRFVTGLSTISNASEFARADCAPRSTSGDGRISGTDWTQAGRYVVGLDAPRLVGGPVTPTSGTSPRQKKDGESGRLLRLLGGATSPAGPVAVPLELVALGDENTLAFSVAFDPTVFRYDTVAYGTALPLNAQLILNTNGAGSGRLGVLLGLPSGTAFTPGTNQVLVVTLLANAPLGVTETQVTFGDEPVIREVGSVAADVLPADYIPARITFGTVTPPSLGIALDSDSQLQVLLSGPAGAVCRVEYLGELGTTNWLPLVTVTLGSTNTLVVDPQPATNQTRFYRAVRLP